MTRAYWWGQSFHTSSRPPLLPMYRNSLLFMFVYVLFNHATKQNIHVWFGCSLSFWKHFCSSLPLKEQQREVFTPTEDEWHPGKVSLHQSVDLFAVTWRRRRRWEEVKGGFPRRTWQRWLTNVGPPDWSMLLWRHTADSRQWTTHSANRPCVLHNTKEEEGSGCNGACCSWTGGSAGGLGKLRPGVCPTHWAAKLKHISL